MEILNFKDNKWDIFHCINNCIIPCSNLAVMAFVDTDTGQDGLDKNELLVIFGGQTYNSLLNENKTSDVREN